MIVFIDDTMVMDEHIHQLLYGCSSAEIEH